MIMIIGLGSLTPSLILFLVGILAAPLILTPFVHYLLSPGRADCPEGEGDCFKIIQVENSSLSNTESPS